MNAPLKHTNITATFDLDPRVAFMARAAALHDLVMLGEIDLDEAFDCLIDQFERIMGYECCPTCGGAPCVNPSFCATCRSIESRTDSRPSPADPRSRTTPDSLVEAIKYSLRARGLLALKEPATIERLGRCDQGARNCINEWIAVRFPGAAI